MNNEYDFDLHIEVTDECYDGDTSVTVKVSYPDLQLAESIQAEIDLHKKYGEGKPITVEYTNESDEYLSDVVKRVLVDVGAYIEDPKEWIEHYRRTSTKAHEQLRQAEQDLARELREVTRYTAYSERAKQRATQAEATVKQLRATIEEVK